MSKIIICGKGACGKDTLKKRFIEKGFQPSISYTTRPKRPEEVEGVDYYFTSENHFQYMIENDCFLEWEEFKGYRYGTHIGTRGNVFIMSTHGISQLPEFFKKGCMVIFLDVPEFIRAKRLMERAGATEQSVAARIAEDNMKFEGFKDFDVRVTNWTI